MAIVSAKSSSALRTTSATATQKGSAIRVTNRGSVPLYVSVVRRRGGEIVEHEKSGVRELSGRGSINFTSISAPEDEDEEIVVVSSRDRKKLRAALRNANAAYGKTSDVSWSTVKVSRSAQTTGQSTKAKRRQKPNKVAKARTVKSPAETAPKQKWRGGGDIFFHSGGSYSPPPPSDRHDEPSPSDSGDGVRQAFGLLECPETVIVDQEFELVVGLTEESDYAELSDAMMIFPDDTTIDVLVIAPGCTVRHDEKWLQSLSIRPYEPLPSVSLHLTVPGSERYRPARTIKAVYSVPGRTLGIAVRSFAVARTESAIASVAPVQPAVTATIPAPTGPLNDLEIIIQRFPEDPPGVLRWHYTSANPDVVLPEEPIRTQIGNEPRRFAQYLLENIDAKETDPDLAEVIRGFGIIIAKNIPQPVWHALHIVAAAPRGQVPNVLILSDEPFVPWELAVTERPLSSGLKTENSLPAILGAQVCIGRWVLAADQRPALPPPDELTIKNMAVVSGRYKIRNRLKEAEREAAELREKYGAADVAAILPVVRRCLKGTPLAQAIHFALHGRYSPEDIAKDGILLVDQKVLGPIAVTGYELDKHDDERPLIFLNACQVGTGDSLLGTYSGMGSAFLIAGAAAVVAPLWSVDDGKARAVALQFYENVLEKGVSPAEFIRGLRAGFQKDADVVDATPLAYQFFGHPQLKVVRLQA